MEEYMTGLMETFEQSWLYENAALLSGLSGLFTFVILSILLFKSVKNRKRIKQESVENGTAIKAKIVKRSSNYNSKSERIYYGEYKYQINGITREYRTDSKNPLPDVILLYPKNKKGTRFFSDYDDIVGAAIAFNVIASIAVGVFIFWIIGYLELKRILHYM